MKEKEVKRNNGILGDKIINIFAVSNKKKYKPLFAFKKNSHSQCKSSAFVKIEQQNQQMLKRLNDLPSCYDKHTWYKDYEKNQEYKKNICVFPSIKFFKDPEQERLMQTSASRFLDLQNQNIRSKTSYQKFKNTNSLERLYGGRYFPNSDENSNNYYFKV